MSNLTTTITEITVHTEGDNPIFANSTTRIKLEDEGGGMFFILNQCNDESKVGEVRLDLSEMKLIYKTAKMMMSQDQVNMDDY